VYKSKEEDLASLEKSIDEVISEEELEWMIRENS
jgi:hypothetical protein